VNPRDPEPVALFDLDGTLADFDGAMVAAMNQLAGPGEPPWESQPQGKEVEPPFITARRRAVKSRPGFWRELPQLADGFEILEAARALGYKIMILTRGPHAQAAAWSEKLDWVRTHLKKVQVTITEDKGLVYGKVLVDDWPDYVTRWLEWRRRGLVIMPARRWNQGFSHPQVLRYVMGQNDDDMRVALQVRREE
jgi:5'-nucleotidase